MVHPRDQQRHSADAAAVAGALGPEAFDAAFAEGATMALDDLVPQSGAPPPTA